MAMSNVEVVRRGFEAFNARDVEAIVELCDPAVEWLPFRAQLDGVAYRGHDGIRRFVADMDDDWDGFRIDPVEFHDRPPHVVVFGRVTGTGRASGVAVDFVGGFVFELRESKIARLVSHSDPAEALASLSARPGDRAPLSAPSAPSDPPRAPTAKRTPPGPGGSA
jgi:ketosteroid isomerase-like protein